MKKLIVFILLTVTIQSFAQTEEERVLQRIKQLNEAIFGAKDSVALENLLSDKVTYGHSTGKIENRQEMIIGAITNANNYTDFKMEDAVVYFKNKTAIVRCVISGTNISKEGKTSPLHLGLLQVWIKQKKQWKLTARQAVKLP